MCVGATNMASEFQEVWKVQGTRDVWVHPRMKNINYQSNVKTGYCRLCKCYHERTGEEGGWCNCAKVFVRDECMICAIEEDNHTSKEWKEEFDTFEEEL